MGKSWRDPRNIDRRDKFESREKGKKEKWDEYIHYAALEAVESKPKKVVKQPYKNHNEIEVE